MASTTSKPTLYYMLESPPSRTVLLIARILGIELDLKKIDLSKKEQLKEEYIKINPFHVVPTLVDTDGFTLWESRVISGYLVQKNAPDSPVYPLNDLKRRATIDKYLHYDIGTLYRAISDVIYPLFQTGKIATDKLPRLQELLKTFEEALVATNGGDGERFVTGETELTLADISLSFTFTLLDVMPQFTLATNYPTVATWLTKVNQSIQQWNKDGLFDRARENMKAYAKMLEENAASSK